MRKLARVLNIERIRALREKAGLSQADAAKLAGFNSRASWNHVESGRRANVTLEMLARIAKALKCKPRDLLTE